jgi:SAM-dependent methyltransferase
MIEIEQRFSDILWRIYHRPDPPKPWVDDGNLPWNDPAFSQRMLLEHLDQSHGAASRVDAERQQQISWLGKKLGLEVGSRLLDVTCGPGLYAVDFAQQGCQVMGIDFSPAAVEYARNLALERGVANTCHFLLEDVRNATYPPTSYDAALFLYGQLGPFCRNESAVLLRDIATALKPGGRLAVELLDQERVDKKNSSWWFTDDKGLWGDRPFLHLGERTWLDEEKISVERFTIIDLETAAATEINLCDQTYAAPQMVNMLQEAGFNAVDVYQKWDDLPLYDAAEWIVYVAQK